MKRYLRRVALALAAAGAFSAAHGTTALGTTALGTTAPTTTALATTASATAAAGDFDDCPALPADAQPSTWTCYAMTAQDTLIRFNKMSAHTKAPIRLTLAQGRLKNGTAAAKVGALRADPIPFVTGIPGTPVEIPHPTLWKLQISTTGAIKPGLLMPNSLGLTARVVGANLGDSCAIGPTTVKPAVQSALPWVGGMRVQVYDSVYALPAATGCAAGTFLVNSLIGLPANATSNHFQVTWLLKTQKY